MHYVIAFIVVEAIWKIRLEACPIHEVMCFPVVTTVICLRYPKELDR